MMLVREDAEERKGRDAEHELEVGGGGWGKPPPDWVLKQLPDWRDRN